MTSLLRCLARLPLAFALLLVATTSTAQDHVEPPSACVEDIETPVAIGGVEDEVDAGAAQAAQVATTGKPARATSKRRSNQVEEIVVQARKRAEFLEETPVSVTALSETTLREAGVTRLDQIQELVPNLQFAPGRENQEGFIRIRGVGTGDGQLVFDPGVGVYIDGVFLPRMIGQLIDVVDVAQVEVLRGPQGTLFGKNTVGGAINISTVRPTENLEAFAFVRAGNFGTVNTRAMLNIPIWEDRVLARFALGTQNTQGYTYNTYRDEYSNNRNALAFLGTVRTIFTDDLVLDLSGTWTRDSNKGRGGECVVVDEEGLGDLVPGFYDSCKKGRPFRFQSNLNGISDAESYGLWGTFNWTPGGMGIFDDLSFKSITSWRQQNPRHLADMDLTEFRVVKLAFVGGDEPSDGAPWFQQQISQEVQVNGSTWEDRINLVSGVFAMWEKGSAPTTVEAFPAQLDVLSLSETSIDNWTWAIYGQGTLDVTSWMSLTAGLRYTQDKKGAGLVVTNLAGAEPVVEQDASDSDVFTSWTPAASLSLLAPDELLDTLSLDHQLAYFSYSRGFRGGGFNALISVQASDTLESFGPETLDSFEIGFKTIALDSRLTANLSLFLGLYDNIQVTTTRTFEDEEGQLRVEALTLNAAQATTKGLELEVLALPLDGLRLTGTLGLLDARYDDFLGISDIDGDPTDRSGQTFPSTPKTNVHLSAQYALPVDVGQSAWMRGWITPRLEWYYQSSMHVGGPELAQVRQDGYSLVHARLSYDFLDDRAQVALWAKNLTDTTYFDTVANVVNTVGTLNRYYQAPRTFGGELSYRF